MTPCHTVLTAELIEQIAARTQAGAFVQVAAEAAGVPLKVFDEWMRLGSRPDAPELHRDLVAVVRHAQAHARCMAEIALREFNPRTWLLNGPGKGTADNPGWSAAVRGQLQADGYAGNPLLQAQMQALLATLMEVLEPYPEACAAVAAALEERNP